MIDWLLVVALGNTLMVAVIALAAFLAGRVWRQPGLVHVLCVVALIKLITPPVFPLEVVPTMSAVAEGQVAAAAHHTVRLAASPRGPSSFSIDLAGDPRSLSRLTGSDAPPPIQSWLSADRVTPGFLFMVVWFLTSGAMAATSLGRAFRFHRALRDQTTGAPATLQRAANQIAARTGLRRTPRLLIARANIAPLVWWSAGRPCVVLPATALRALPSAQLRLVLAHELVHIRRLDHWTRWLEWIACTLFWWNPLTWWIQRELRWAEEICCDQWVLSLFRPRRRDYALSIVNILETLAGPAVRPPAMASEINSGGKLELRIETIMNTKSHTSPSPMARILAAALAILVIPFGLAYSQDFDKVERKLRKSVEKGHLSEHQANAMLELLERMMHEEDAHEHERELAAHARELERAMDESRREMEMVRMRMHEVEEAVEEGDLEEREAERELHELRVHLRELELRMAQLEREMVEVENAHIERERHRAEEAGYRQREENREREIRDRAAALRDQAQRHLEELRRKLRQAVKEGELDVEEAERKLHAAESEIERKLATAMRQQHETNLKERIEQRLNRMKMRLEQAVEQGEIQAEEARKKFDQLKAEALEQLRAKRSEHEDDHGDEDDEHESGLKAIAEELHAAVEAGKMSPEVAKKRFAEIREKLEFARKRRVEDDDDEAEHDDGDDDDLRRIRAEKLRAVAMEIRRAVRDGKLSEQEAREKLQSLRKEMMRAAGADDDDDRDGEMDDDDEHEDEHAEDEDDDDHHDEDDDGDDDDDDLRL